MSNKQLFIQCMNHPALLGLRKLASSENNNIYEFELRIPYYDSDNILKEDVSIGKLNCKDQLIIDWLDKNGWHIELYNFYIDKQGDDVDVVVIDEYGCEYCPKTFLDFEFYDMLEKIDQNEE